jgi:hypothetical protein
MAAAHCCCSSYLENMSSSLPRRIKIINIDGQFLGWLNQQPEHAWLQYPYISIYNYIQWECFYGPHPKLQGYITIYYILSGEIHTFPSFIGSELGWFGFFSFSRCHPVKALLRRNVPPTSEVQSLFRWPWGLDGAVGENHSIPNSILSGND